MSRSALINPLRISLGPRPAIQAWRSARRFATEVSPTSTITSPPPASIIETTAPASVPVSSSLLSESITCALAETSLVSKTIEEEAQDASKPKRSIVGVVVSAGKMDKTVKVRIPGQKFNKHLRKYFRQDTNHLVHDPKSSLNVGDVVSLSPHRAAKHVHHIVQEILVPFGPPITERPHVPTEEERRADYDAKRRAKAQRRNLRRSAAEGNEYAIEKLKTMGLDPDAAAAGGEKNAKKGGQFGKKGQKLPTGVLPGGLHAVGKIGDRAKSNKDKAIKREEKAENNLRAAKNVAADA